ncbi:zinc finger protein 385D-like isoform X3 [Portunus trituberculatus]|nr:zinc finger protein 385D-like isoform X3 [Portunus trituberculatus]XP_045104784.1 zinc finger protein 385D-like isoform X3 [Portunus trituberculatus]
MVPLHQITDTAAGIPWYVTTSPSFSTSQPAFQRFSLTTTCPASKRNSIASLMSGSGACKLPELVVSDVLGVGLQVLDFTMSYMPTSVPYVPFPAPSPPQPPTMSVAPGNGNIPSPNSAIMASVEMTNDPVTKAVMENVLGRLPTKVKPKVTVRCDVCNLEFYSQAVLDSHLAGSKHQRKVKSADLMKTLEETETGFERDEVSGVIRCIVCDVTVNSPQLLATHIAGNKHKQRAAKRSGESGTAPPTKRPCSGVTGQVSMETATIRNSNGGPQDPTHQANNTSLPKTGNSAGSSSLEIPDCVTKLEETKGGGKYLCNPCQAHCNSEQQLAQHLTSRKHQDKLSGRKPERGGWRGRRRPGFRGRPYGRNIHLSSRKHQDKLSGRKPEGGGWRGRRRAAFRGRPGGRGRPSHTYTQPLSSNFVAGGALL